MPSSAAAASMDFQATHVFALTQGDGLWKLFEEREDAVTIQAGNWLWLGWGLSHDVRKLEVQIVSSETRDVVVFFVC